MTYDCISSRVFARDVPTEQEKYFCEEDADPPVAGDGRVVEGRQPGRVLGDDVAPKCRLAFRQDSRRQSEYLEC